MTAGRRNIARGVGYLMGGRLAQRFNAFLNLMVDRQFERLKLSSLPVITEVEVTNRCNLSCEICSRAYHRLNMGDIGEEVCSQIKSFLPQVSELYLFGYGEPLISSRFHDLLELATALSVRVHFATNGLLINDAMAEEICNNYVTAITFSIDGATKQTYEKIRRGANFETLIKNISWLNNLKKMRHAKFPKLQVEFVAMRSNVEELPQLIELVPSFGVSRVKVNHLIVWSEDLRHESLFYHPGITHKVFNIAREKARRFGVLLDLPHNFSQNSNGAFDGQKTRMIKCYFPWCYTYIKYDGAVHACCYQDKFVMGNILEKPFAEIWNDKPYQNLRMKVNSATPPNECLTCDYRWRSIMNSASESTYIRPYGRKK